MFFVCIVGVICSVCSVYIQETTKDRGKVPEEKYKADWLSDLADLM